MNEDAVGLLKERNSFDLIYRYLLNESIFHKDSLNEMPGKYLVARLVTWAFLFCSR